MRRSDQRKLISPDAGYTLTEMLVVIGIICLIAAVLTPALVGQLNHARVKAAQIQLQTVAAEIESFRTDVGRYPTQQEGLAVLLKEPAGAEGWAGPYAKDAKALVDPWGRPLIYTLDANGQGYHVKTLGADGKPGGTGIDRDLEEPETQ
jgi:general secretion pathway protein G